jgi:NDP-sugar pyrophosphorylase family protein
VSGVSPILCGGIIAAGQGSRLNAASGGKAMAVVCGRPLIEHAVERLRAAGIARLAIIINESDDECRRWLATHAGDLALDLIVRSTPSSYASFRLVVARLGGARAIVTTVDGVMPAEDFRAFLDRAAKCPEDAVVLGLTGFVDDEAPLWASLDQASGIIRSLGGDSGSHVTAGLYVLPAQSPAPPEAGFARLRDYLGWLVAEGFPVYGVALPRVFDIDRARDVAAAERARGDRA